MVKTPGSPDRTTNTLQIILGIRCAALLVDLLEWSSLTRSGWSPNRWICGWDPRRPCP